MSDAAGTLKHVTLELGGKSPLIVFDDAELDDAVSGALLANFYSAGEVCSNGTRVFVHEAVKAKFLRRLVARVQRHADRRPAGSGDAGRRADLRGAHAEGARLHRARARRRARKRAGRRRRVARTARSRKGFFVEPTVFDGCRDDMSIVREEIFGPVMTRARPSRTRRRSSRAPTPPSSACPPASSRATSPARIASSRELAGRHLLDQPATT